MRLRQLIAIKMPSYELSSAVKVGESFFGARPLNAFYRKTQFSAV